MIYNKFELRLFDCLPSARSECKQIRSALVMVVARVERSLICVFIKEKRLAKNKYANLETLCLNQRRGQDTEPSRIHFARKYSYSFVDPNMFGED